MHLKVVKGALNKDDPAEKTLLQGLFAGSSLFRVQARGSVIRNQKNRST